MAEIPWRHRAAPPLDPEEEAVVALVGPWRVVARRFPDEVTAARAWLAIRDAHPRGDFSVWRTTTPSRDLHLLVVCGAPERLDGVELEGEPFLLDRVSAERFALRRARALAEATEQLPEDWPGDVSTEGHYPEGVRIADDGDVVAADTRRATGSLNTRRNTCESK